VALIALAFTVSIVLLIEPADVDILARLQRSALLVLLVIAMLLAYFDLRARALSPALAEARLQALQARIRPHFLFNSINAVLSLIREDPKRAEAALEDLADLFRVVMADNRELIPISREIELCQRYLDLEQLRLGDRLRVVWRIDKMPHDALVPPLILQPLIENAVYHGIEPRVEPGEIVIDIYVARDRVHAVLHNPFERHASHHSGNKMAIDNIRERLQLHFDAEASLETRMRDNAYQVHIVLPYVKAES
jgi:two-component system sensor histidine kinase AlgZ